MPRPKINREIRKPSPIDVAREVRKLQKRKATFTHVFSNYTNTIVTEEKTIKWLENEMHTNVWIAANTLKKDLERNPRTGYLNAKQYPADNYYNNDFEPGTIFEFESVINLDITACYPYTLYNEQLICQATLSHLLRIKKRHRLAAIGMIAYNRLIYEYENGTCINISQESGQYRNIFFYVVHKVQQILLECAEIAGPAYLFHWVDGIFLHPAIPVKILNRIEKYLQSVGYQIYLEQAKNFRLEKTDDKLKVSFEKKGKNKEYHFLDARLKAEQAQLIKDLHTARGVSSFT